MTFRSFVRKLRAHDDMWILMFLRYFWLLTAIALSCIALDQTSTLPAAAIWTQAMMVIGIFTCALIGWTACFGILLLRR